MGRDLLQHGAAPGRPALNPLPWRGSSLFAEARCDPRWREFRTLESASALHYTNTLNYDNYVAEDLEPDHPPFLPDTTLQGLANGSGYGDWNASATAGGITPGPSYLPVGQRLKVGECTVAAPGGGVWHTQRVGPFVSTGGYDWWQ